MSLLAHARRVSLACAVVSGSLAVASFASAAPPPDGEMASDLVHVLRSMQRRGELNASDAARLTLEAMSRVPDGVLQPPSSSLSHCSMLARFEARRWAHERGGTLAYPPPPHAGYVESTSLPIRVYYETSWDESMAQDSLMYAEQAWAALVDQYGYPPPFTDGDDGTPAQGMWLYVAESGMGGGGYTEPLSDVPWTALSDCSSRIVVDSANTPDYVQEVVYHEFVHTTQMATDCAESISAFENFAVAAEHVHEPYSSTFAYGFLPEFQSWPGYPVDYWTGNDSSWSEPLNYYQYGAGLFPVFLLDRFGASDPAYLNTLWQSFAQEGTVDVKPWKITNDKGNDPDWFEGLHAFLQAKDSGFNDAFRQFAQWRAVVGSRHDLQHFKNGADYPEPALAVVLSGPAPASGSLKMREYGSQYVDFHPLGYQGGIRFTVTTSVLASWTADLLLWHDIAPVDVVPLELAGVTGSAEIPSLQGVSAVTLVVSQFKDLHHEPDDMDYNNERQVQFSMEVTDDPEPEPALEAGVEPEAGIDAGATTDAAQPPGATGFDPTGYEAGGGGCGCRAVGTRPQRALLAAALLGLAWGAARRRRKLVS